MPILLGLLFGTGRLAPNILKFKNNTISLNFAVTDGRKI
ncbi:hypothetical protein CAMRE0001_0846 [Campylobacter rectus RM3267]|uniref:Uncharacterized protein n=1 Tax=Campylobacter rectus RM3267 TaxID=553218 RepID=B9D4Y1_CAMRE|nr:hypothetical protein CAMRE0001_0846 [Campylobacter rectus RM3267]